MINWKPQPVTERVIAPTGLNIDQRGYVEVTVKVPVVHHESWGTTRHEYVVTGKSDGFSSMTRESIDSHLSQARARALATADQIQGAQPDYQNEPRY